MVKRQAATRIIGGKYKGTKLVFKPNKMLRPTESKTKETLFNWLLNDLDKKKCLDMFAGTGSLGLEAISRGASNVVFIEKQLKLSQSIIDIAKKLKIEKISRVINTNSISFDYKTLKQKFDIIFLDPPFHEDLIPKSLEVICNQNLLNEGGLIYVECEKDLKLDLSKFDLNELKESKGGETKYYLYEG